MEEKKEICVEEKGGTVKIKKEMREKMINKRKGKMKIRVKL